MHKPSGMAYGIQALWKRATFVLKPPDEDLLEIFKHGGQPIDALKKIKMAREVCDNLIDKMMDGG